MTKAMEAMTSVDTAWLRMDQDTNHMMITGVLILDQPLEPSRFKTLLENRLLCFDRFRQKVVNKMASFTGKRIRISTWTTTYTESAYPIPPARQSFRTWCRTWLRNSSMSTDHSGNSTWLTAMRMVQHWFAGYTTALPMASRW